MVAINFTKAVGAIAISLVSSAMIGTAANAGVITVVIDNFDGAALATPGTVNTTVLSNPDSRVPPITVGPTGGKFAIDLATNVAGEVMLSYGSVPLPAGYSSARISYIVTFSNLGNDSSTVLGVGGPNTISILGGATNSYLALPTSGSPNGVIDSLAFAGGKLDLMFRTSGARSWDLSIDSLELKVQCNGVADVTYGVTGTTAAPVSGLAAYLKAVPASCGTVPVPASAALLAFGLLGFAFRRKA
jgi:hypothetical protein